MEVFDIILWKIQNRGHPFMTSTRRVQAQVNACG